MKEIFVFKNKQTTGRKEGDFNSILKLKVCCLQQEESLKLTTTIIISFIIVDVELLVEMGIKVKTWGRYIQEL